MEKEYYIILMEKLNMKEIMLMVKEKDMEKILQQKEIIILVNGKII